MIVESNMSPVFHC